MSKDIKVTALDVIETLTLVYQDGRKTLKDAENILDEIYRYSHIANGHCKNLHKDWVEEMDKMYDALKKDYL